MNTKMEVGSQPFCESRGIGWICLDPGVPSGQGACFQILSLFIKELEYNPYSFMNIAKQWES